jgi:pimeloyl-ACP methyl ester carboxylesterase
MTTTAVRRPHPHDGSTPADRAVTRGPFRRILVGALTFGVLAAAVLTLVALPGAVEHITTGAALLAFAAGWALLAALTSRMTDRPQRWAYLPAAFLGVSGLALIALAPGDEASSAAAWIWPPALLLVVAWSQRRARASMPGRTRWLVYPVLGALGLASIGTLLNDIALLREDVTAAMPGSLYDVGGHRLHLHCSGTGGPTVVLENGLALSSPLWGRITEDIRGTTRVCAYDRAGQGWSEEARAPQDGAAITRDLHALLDAAGERGPFVLAGHSTGGVYALTYAARYPDQVAGLVLLDSASPHQFTVLPAYDSQYQMMRRLYGVLPTLARLGIGRLIPILSSNDVPGIAGVQAAAFANTPRSARTARDEVSTYRRSFVQAQELTTLGNKPLVVVSATGTLTGTDGWPAAQEGLAALSSNADQRTATGTHGGVLDDPEASRVSVTAIADVVEAVRTGSPLTAS